MEEILQFIDNKASPEEKMNILLFLLKLLTSGIRDEEVDRMDSRLLNDEQYVNNHHDDHVHVNSMDEIITSSSSDEKNTSSISIISLQQDEQSTCYCCTNKKVSSLNCKYKLNMLKGEHDIVTSIHVTTFLKDPFIVDTLDTMANKCAIRKMKRKRGRPRKNFCK